MQPGDQILDANGTSLKDVTYTTASQALRQTLPKVFLCLWILVLSHIFNFQVKMTVYRANTIEYTTVETDLVKKPGKGLGLSVVARKCGKGVYISEIVSIL